jgi:hypothetical protein
VELALTGSSLIPDIRRLTADKVIECHYDYAVASHYCIQVQGGYDSTNEVSRPCAKFQILILQSNPVLITLVESDVTAKTRPVRAPIRSFRSLPDCLSHILYQLSLIHVVIRPTLTVPSYPPDIKWSPFK